MNKIGFFIAFVCSFAVGTAFGYMFSIDNPFIEGGIQGATFVVVLTVYERFFKNRKSKGE